MQLQDHPAAAGTNSGAPVGDNQKRDRHDEDRATLPLSSKKLRPPGIRSVGWALVQAARLHRARTGDRLAKLGLFAGQCRTLLPGILARVALLVAGRRRDRQAVQSLFVDSGHVTPS